ncbi:MAG: SPOR domain-containing protein [Oscillospiraceae bacterium]|jgi:N-acetylmuramoyl-L-alanine amidase|nr:SPOR domain-containing protein [Oscillospiraceae bacterium]
MQQFRKDVQTKMNEKVEDKKLYRVQVGAFAVKENAENFLKKLKAEGYDAIIV